MNELFGGKLAPITNTIGFLRYDLERAAEAFFQWQEGIQTKRGVSLTKEATIGDLEAAIPKLLPLTSVERRRYLFIPTRSKWVAFFDNGHQGTDVFAPLSYLARQLSCEALRATYNPEGRAKQYPAVILEMYGPRPTDFLNYVRSISAAYDGKKWAFATGGEAQPFEQVERYTAKSVRDRFTPEMLESYLKAMGINAFESDFYMPAGQAAILIEKSGPIAPAVREFQLVDLA
jgi:hypothetical protein